MRRFALPCRLCFVAIYSSAILGCLNQQTPRESASSTTPEPDKALITCLGYFEPAGETRSLEFIRNGVIASIDVQRHDFVTKDAVLAKLDDASVRLAIDAAKKEVQLAQAEAKALAAGAHPAQVQAAEKRGERLTAVRAQAQRNLDRLKPLHASGSVSPQDMEAAELALATSTLELAEGKADLERLRTIVRPDDLAVSQARVDTALARVTQLEQELSEMRLLAPFDGRPIEILKREGEVVSSLRYNPVMIFADDRQLRVRAEVDERFVHCIRVGQQATVTGVGLGNSQFVGKVIEVKTIMGPKTVFAHTSGERKDLDTLEFFVELPPDCRAPIGLRVDVQVDPTPPAESPLEPAGASKPRK